MTVNPNRVFVMSVPYGEVGGTKEVYGLGLGIESLSGSPFTVTMWRSSLLCGRHGCRVRDAGEVCSQFPSLFWVGG